MSASVNFDALAALPRAAIAHLVEKLIDRMDAMEPDCDLEEDDPSAIDTGEDHFGPVIRNGVAFWLKAEGDFYDRLRAAVERDELVLGPKPRRRR